MMPEQHNTNHDRASAKLMAIVNLTPDSFYAASRNFSCEEVERRVERAISEGADILDFGGYSTRPGAEEVPMEEEWRRVRMGLAALRRCGGEGVTLSIDSFRAEVVRRAYEEFGPFIVNDISAGELDEGMIATVARYGLSYVAMHMRSTPQDMQQHTEYRRGVVEEVVAYFERRVEELVARGVAREAIVVDPGFGFSKLVEQNWELMAAIPRLAERYRVLVGVSRKSMLYKPLGLTAEDVLPATLAVGWEALRSGAEILRVHDVAATRQIIDLYNYAKNVER